MDAIEVARRLAGHSARLGESLRLGSLIPQEYLATLVEEPND
jgi:hypothetical protein